MVIKKLNSMFHKHSRWLFGIFAAVIIIAFMDFLTPGRGGCAFSGGPESEVAGTAFGKKVTFGDLMELDRSFQVLQLIQIPFYERDAKTLFWLYCVMERANQLGYTIPEKDIVALVQQLPVFVENGKFSKPKYDKFLKDHQLSSSQLHDALKNYFIVNMLPQALAGNTDVSDSELETVFRSNFPRIAILAFKVNAADFEKKVKFSDDDLKKYLDANKARYVIPGSLNALVIELPFAVYTADAEKAVTPEAVAKFIKDNNVPKEQTAMIRPYMVNSKTRELATAQMNRFYTELLDAMEKAEGLAAKIKVFRDIAAKYHLTVVEADNVKFGSAAIGKINAPEVVKSLQNMPLSEEISPVIRPLETERGIVIAALTKSSAPRQMTFAEAKAMLTKDYCFAEALKLARAHAEKLLAGVMKLKPAERQNAFRKLGKMETISYSMISAPENNPAHMAIIQAANNTLRTMKSGDISPVISCADGVVIIEMIKRFPAPMEEFAKNRDSHRAMIANIRAQQRQMEFMEYIERNCRFEAETQAAQQEK